MKKIKILLLLLTVSVAGFYSCNDNDPVENEIVTTKSIALRTTINEFKKANNISGRLSNSTQNQTFCFEFVFPLTLSYNDGTVITVSTYEGLIDVLTAETETLFIVGIAFPFQVQQQGAIITIDDEAEFYSLIEDCGFSPINDDVLQFSCWQIVYPISVINEAGATVVVTTQGQFESLLMGGTVAEIVFPINVEQNNQNIEVNDLYQLFDLNDDCEGNDSSCNCTTDVNPVCVQAANGTIISYTNACLAACDGFTPSNFVNCNSSTTPNFGNNLGSCFTMSYPVQIQYQGTVITANNDGEVLQYYFPSQSNIPAFVYPLTINYITPSGPVAITIDSQAGFEAATSGICN